MSETSSEAPRLGARICGTTVTALAQRGEVWARYSANNDTHGDVWLWEFLPSTLVELADTNQVIARKGMSKEFDVAMSALREDIASLYQGSDPLPILAVGEAFGTCFVVTRPIVAPNTGVELLGAGNEAVIMAHLPKLKSVITLGSHGSTLSLQPERISHWLSELTTAGFRQYRYGFGDAVTLALIAMSLVVMLTFVPQVHYTSYAPTPFFRTCTQSWCFTKGALETARRSLPKPDDEPKERVDAWPRPSVAETQGTHGLAENQEIDRAFAELSPSDPAQARRFLNVFGENKYAQEQGYIGAVERALQERKLYRTGSVVPCGQDWCWRNAPQPTRKPRHKARRSNSKK